MAFSQDHLRLTERHMQKPVVSIIICTHNRADTLRATLLAMGRVRIPDDLAAELLVVDNASSDHTPEIVSQACLPNLRVRYLREERRGQSIAKNRALREAQGEILLFTDDDVRPSEDWIEAMCRPIKDHTAPAVAGRVDIPVHLQREWLTPRLQLCFVGPQGEAAVEGMPGANMAISREVLTQVPGYDPELGGGALGFGEETLFNNQLKAAGFRWIHGGERTVVEHHFDESRLRHDALLASARNRGRSHGYLEYHWKHSTIRFPRLRLVKAYVALFLTRARLSFPSAEMEGMTDQEFAAWRRVGFLEQYLAECRRTRRYDRHGLVRRSE